MESGGMTRLMVMESIIMLTVQVMLVSGLRMSIMDMEFKSGLMDLFIMETIKMGKKMEMVNYCGLTNQYFKAIFLIIKFKVWVNLHGQLKKHMKVYGKIIKWKETVFFIGLMGVNMKDNIKMI
jgi:hypothetical protein